ncbi:hypothetical protein GGX14DRAFT_403111 [Mycena pura]|uniref:Uncharacterized protein n=1 Tax=Mycena pura TaxID=153505 RepID=A0AAD6UYJ6_9AGAR|nr:hypothetical protein GGX14DRAFT_403111 [Mycena pura]
MSSPCGTAPSIGDLTSLLTVSATARRAAGGEIQSVEVAREKSFISDRLTLTATFPFRKNSCQLGVFNNHRTETRIRFAKVSHIGAPQHALLTWTLLTRTLMPEVKCGRYSEQKIGRYKLHAACN